jgi:hypothetical protein
MTVFGFLYSRINISNMAICFLALFLRGLLFGMVSRPLFLF